MSDDPPLADARPNGAITGPSWLALALYVLAIAGVGGLAVWFSYLAFDTGFVENADQLLTDPAGAVQDQTTGLLALLGALVAVGTLVGVLVVGARYLEPPDDGP